MTPESLKVLADAGFTRVSFGMQSAVPHVLKVLDRTHTPSRVPLVVQWAREAGLAVSLDLIYGTPGESMADWQLSLETALSYEPDHISAYALIVEDGTKLAAQIRRGEVPGIDDDDHAAKYELADRLISAAGLGWYEVSNWSRTPEQACRHNLAYWRGRRLVGHRARRALPRRRRPLVERQAPHGVRGRLGSASSPAAGRETLDAETREVERIMLEARLRSGLSVDALDAIGRHADRRADC